MVPGTDPFGLADPASLLGNHIVSNLPDGWSRDGAGFEHQLPYNRLFTSGQTGLFLPDYTPGIGSTLGGLAYGLYLFDPGEIDGGVTIHCIWGAAPLDYNDSWVGVANFGQNKWDWFQPGSSSQVFLDSSDQYKRVETDGMMAVAIALGGDSPAVLERIWLGAGIAADTIYAVPEKTVVEPGEVVRVNVFVRETAEPLRNVVVRILVTEGNTLVDGSFNIGATGGAADDMDGLWAECGTDAALVGAGGGGANSPEGFNALDFTIAPLGGSNMELATGALFNFLLEVNHSTNLNFERKSIYDLDRTFYINNIDQLNHPWTNDTNQGMQKIRLQGWPTAVLEVDVSTGNTPFVVQFDATESWDEEPGAIEKYEFDFGEGEGYEDYGSNPKASHVYDSHNIFPTYLKVTDNSGHTGVDQISIYSKGFEEIEHNDDEQEAQEISIPVVGFRGNVGDGEFPEAYDGDNHDYYKFTVPADKFIRLVPDWRYYQVSLHSALYIPGEPGRVRFFTDWTDSHSPSMHGYFEYYDEYSMNDLMYHISASILTDYELSIFVDPPEAVVHQSAFSGTAPLTVNFDFSDSYSRGGNSIIRYTMDEDNGSGFVECGVQGISRTYTEEGLYFLYAKVEDENGAYDIHRMRVFAGKHYDEIEPNGFSFYQDDPPLLNLPVMSFTGNVGDGHGSPAYDNSVTDYFYFEHPENQRLNIEVRFPYQAYFLEISLNVPQGGGVAYQTGKASPLNITYDFREKLGDLCRFRIHSWDAGDYEMDIWLTDLP